MKTELVLLIVGAAVAALLYAGLPEQAPMRNAPSPDVRRDAHGPNDSNSQTSSTLVTEVERLRRLQGLLANELTRLDRQIDGSVMQTTAEVSAQTALDARDQPGVTIYLQTGPADSPTPSNAWSAISFRDAGTAPDGSHRAVMSIYPELSTSRTHSMGTYPATKARWQ